MLRALGLRGASNGNNDTSNWSHDKKVELVLKEAQDFEICLTAMDYVLDDRPDDGLKLIENENGAIHKLATGVVYFIEFTMGFELDTREKLQKTLAELETLSQKLKLYNEKNDLKTSSIYPPGTEYAVTLAESTLLNLLCMLLSESMIESAKALYKLRRAYQILDDLSNKIEKNLSKKVSQASLASGRSSSTLTLDTSDSSSSGFVNKFADVPIPLTEQQMKDAKIIKHCEKVLNMRKSRHDGSNIGNEALNTRLRSDLGLNSSLLTPTESEASFSTTNNLSTSTIDEYIQSGVLLCFGILQVVLSLIPPAIGKVLSIVGFKGSREAGLKMLWKATELRNIHGSLGLISLLVFYDGPFQFTDSDFDVPVAGEQTIDDQDDEKADADTLGVRKTVSRLSSKLSLKRTLSKRKMELESKAQSGVGEPTLLHPGKKLESLLLQARASFPNSALWITQEGRMLASHARSEEAVELMDTVSSVNTNMVQLESLLVFDRAMILAFLHRYERAANDFKRLIEINAWSPGMYYYLIGACYLESWRMCTTKLYLELPNTDVDPSKEDWYLAQLIKHFKVAPDMITKGKKVMPFDKYYLRKLAQMGQTSKQYKLSLADAAGTSLIHELCYFWNGYNRMPPQHLQLSLKLLQYNAKDTSDLSVQFPELSKLSKIPTESVSQQMLRHTLQAISLRRLGQLKEGNKLIDKVVQRIVTPDGKFNKLHEDPWLYPTALYEKLLFVWKIEGVNGLDNVRSWLDKAMAYGGGDYELSTRISMKIKAAIDRLDGL